MSDLPTSDNDNDPRSPFEPAADPPFAAESDTFDSVAEENRPPIDPNSDLNSAPDDDLNAEVYTLDDLRLEALDRAIRRDPQAAINVLLRGELYLALAQAEAATADFRQAIALATAEQEALRWGYANTALIDRATDGLREAAHLPVQHPPAASPIMAEPIAGDVPEAD